MFVYQEGRGRTGVDPYAGSRQGKKKKAMPIESRMGGRTYDVFGGHKKGPAICHHRYRVISSAGLRGREEVKAMTRSIKRGRRGAVGKAA